MDSKSQMKFREKRNFLRHPISVPLEVETEPRTPENTSRSIDLSQGGLCFLWGENLSKGSPIFITIPVKNKNFKIKARVAYTEKMNPSGFFRIGAAFVDYTSAFHAKLAEETIEILLYRKKISEERGQEISEEAAASEWIKKYAEGFSD